MVSFLLKPHMGFGAGNSFLISIIWNHWVLLKMGFFAWQATWEKD